MTPRAIILFDVDNTLCESGKEMDALMQSCMTTIYERFHTTHDFGIVGGGSYARILQQLRTTSPYFVHIFSEGGCVYHYKHEQVYAKRIWDHQHADAVDHLIKRALVFLAGVPYRLTGHLINYRSGLVYVSCIGNDADESQRLSFLQHHGHVRDELLRYLKHENACPHQIAIKKGGNVGIALFPIEWSKVQVLDIIHPTYQTIWYIADSIGEDGNDHELLHHPYVHGIHVKNPAHTSRILQHMLSTMSTTIV